MNETKEEEYRPPSSFFYEMDNDGARRTSCTKTKCKMCIITTGICTLGVFLVKFLVDHWHSLEDIS